MPSPTDSPPPAPAIIPIPTIGPVYETASSLRARTAPLPAQAPLVAYLQHPDGSIEPVELILCQAVGRGANSQLQMRFRMRGRAAGMAVAKGIESAAHQRSHL
jgi:hypothetical protein